MHLTCSKQHFVIFVLLTGVIASVFTISSFVEFSQDPSDTVIITNQTTSNVEIDSNIKTDDI